MIFRRSRFWIPLMLGAFLLVTRAPRSGTGQQPTPVIPTPLNTPKPTPAPPQGEWVAVTRETLHDVIPTMATFRAKQATKLGSQVAGRVEAVLVDVGSKVKKG